MKDSNNPLISAIRRNDFVALKEHLTDSETIETHDAEGNVALVQAAFERSQEAVKLLLEAGANVNAQDSFGSTALHWACEWSETTIVDILLSYGADVTLKDSKGEDAFYLAADNGKRGDHRQIGETSSDKNVGAKSLVVSIVRRRQIDNMDSWLR